MGGERLGQDCIINFEGILLLIVKSTKTLTYFKMKKKSTVFIITHNNIVLFFL